MNENRLPLNRSQSKFKSTDIYYVIKYIAEGSEKECFHQNIERENRNHFTPELSRATLFRSLESARSTARALDKRHPAGRNSHAVVKVRLSVIAKIVTYELERKN
jgi:hypothetical protein